MPPIYDPESVKPMIEELTTVGVESLSSPAAVDELVSQREGIAMVVVNSVCGCAAGNCRPGVTLALQNDLIPDHVGTVFAGVDTEAVDRARALMPEVPPSSPCIALFDGGSLMGILERRHIEQMTALDIANALTKVFNEHCKRQGPSVPKEVFDEQEAVKRCGSTIPLYQGD